MSKHSKTKADAERFVTAVAAKQDWRLPADRGFLEALEEGLAKNHTRYGYFLCPCREGTGDREKDRDIICPCEYCVPDQREYGHCYCGLYLTPEFAAGGNQPQSIPERRPEWKETE